MMHFGKWIMVSFIAFALFIGALVTICTLHNITLVSPQYYRDERAYPAKYEQRNNTNTLAEKPKITASSGKLQVNFSESMQIVSGTVVVIRPSNVALDHHFKLTTGPLHEFTLSKWEPGLYRVSLSWRMNGKEYYMDQTVVM